MLELGLTNPDQKTTHKNFLAVEWVIQNFHLFKLLRVGFYVYYGIRSMSYCVYVGTLDNFNPAHLFLYDLHEVLDSMEHFRALFPICNNPTAK